MEHSSVAEMDLPSLVEAPLSPFVERELQSCHHYLAILLGHRLAMLPAQRWLLPAIVVPSALPSVAALIPFVGMGRQLPSAEMDLPMRPFVGTDLPCCCLRHPCSDSAVVALVASLVASLVPWTPLRT